MVKKAPLKASPKISAKTTGSARRAPLVVAFQADPFAKLNLDYDTTFAQAREALKRGFTCYWYGPENLIWREGKVMALGVGKLRLDARGNPMIAEVLPELDLAAVVDIVWLRQDPPYDLGYITTTHFLERLPPSVHVLNDPTGVRNFPEKVMPLLVPQHAPETLVAPAVQLDAFRAFVKKHKTVVLKPLYGFAGHGIVKVSDGDGNLLSILENFNRADPRVPVLAQRFLPGIVKGDKRVLVVDGEVLGVFNRLPPKGSIRAAIAAGGVPVKTFLTPGEKAAMTAIKPILREHGLFFAGVDFIQGMLTEVNVTSPGGFIAYEKAGNPSLIPALWDETLRYINNRSGERAKKTPSAA